MIKRRNNIRLVARCGLILFAVMAMALPGCKKKDPPPPPQATPLPRKTATAPTAPAQPALANRSTAKLTAAKPVLQKQVSTARKPLSPGGVSLDFTNKRDPFRPYVQAPVTQPAGSAKGRIRDPLPIQSFDTEKFRITGIITGIKENSALVMDPNGKGYVIKQGMQIGSNEGYVKKVTASSVEIEEMFRDDNGKVRKRIVKLTLLRKK